MDAPTVPLSNPVHVPVLESIGGLATANAPRPRPEPVRPPPAPPLHAVAVVGGAIAGSEAARVLSERGVLVVVLEQKDRPYGKIEDGLPRWHTEQRERQFRAIDDRLTKPHVHYVPRVRLGRDVTIDELFRVWGVEAVLLANGAWRDRPLTVEGAEGFEGNGLVYQNPLVAWFNHAATPGYDGPTYEVRDGALVVGGGLASIDVIKILQLELALRALSERGIEEDLVRLEHEGIPRALARHGLAWDALGLAGSTLVYRRRTEDMPLAWAQPQQGEAALERAREVRRKIMARAQEKYCFRFVPCRAPVAPLAANGELSGLVLARTEVPAGRSASPSIVAGSEERHEAPMVVSSIGSTPEPLPGVPMRGELYCYKDEASGELEGYDGVYALGNVVTGQGNIQASLKHANAVAHHVVASYLGVGDAIEPDAAVRAEFDPLLAIASRRASDRTEAVFERLRGRAPLGPEAIERLLARVRALQARAGYTDYASWIARSRPGGRLPPA